MLLFSHYVKTSFGNGAGLFTKYQITKGERVYEPYSAFVRVYKYSELEDMSFAASDAIYKYGYKGNGEKRIEDGLYFNTDDSRFIKHSTDPNIVLDEQSNCYVAARDIQSDEEITCDYLDRSIVEDGLIPPTQIKLEW